MNTLKQKLYEYINDIGWDNVTIELIEEYPCETKKELNTREKYYINQFSYHNCKYYKN